MELSVSPVLITIIGQERKFSKAVEVTKRHDLPMWRQRRNENFAYENHVEDSLSILYSNLTA